MNVRFKKDVLMSRIALYLILIYMSVSVSFQSCSNSTEPNIETNDVTINDPTNDYRVDATVIKFGFFGCAFVTVNNDGSITDADVSINEVEFFHDFDGQYQDSTGSMKYEVGKKYELKVSHNGAEIAHGIAIMPSEPTILGLPDTSLHPAGEALKLSWEKPSSASSVQVLMIKDNIFELYETEFLEPGISSHTIPGEEFTLNGEYDLMVIAYHGFLPGVNEDSSKGYNISGAAGVFLASNFSPTVVLNVVDGVDLSINKTISENSDNRSSTFNNSVSRVLKSKNYYDILRIR